MEALAGVLINMSGELISLPLKPRPEDWQRLATQLNDRLNASTSAAFFVWNRGCRVVPTNTTIANAEEIIFPSPFTDNGTMIVTVFDAEGGVHVALNEVDLGPLTGPASVEIRYEIPVTNLTEGEDNLNSFKIWSTSADTAELRKLEVYRDFTAEQTNSEFNENRTYVKFDGSINGSRLEVVDDDAWDFEASEAGTWEWQGYFDTVGVQQVFLAKNLSSSGSGWGARITAAGLFQVFIRSGANIELLHQTTPLPRRWNHFAFTRTATGIVTSCLNGIPSDTTVTENLTLANSDPLQFGVRESTLNELTGRMRDIRRWSDVRTQEEIVTNIRVDLVGDELGLIGFWPFRNGTGGTASQAVSTAPASDALFITTGPTWAGAVGNGFATDNSDALTGQLILFGATIEQSSGGVARILTEGMATGVAFDGDTFTFDPARDAIPTIVWGAGGKTESSALTPPTWKDFQAQSLTTSGFTAFLKISEIEGSLTSRIETGATTGGTFDFEMNKDETADEAFDDNYTLQIDVSVNAAVGGAEPDPSTVTVAYIANNGAGFVEKATKIFTNVNTGSAKAFLNNLQTINIDGMGLNDDWAVNVKSTGGNGGSITAFDNVTYESGSAGASTESATPTGVSGINFEIKSGEEGSVT